MDVTQFRNVVGFLGRPTAIDRCVDAMGQDQHYSSANYQSSRILLATLTWRG
jgi:hypothetical protein